MRVPHTIPAHAFEAFRCSEETLLLPGEQGRTLRSENKDWDGGLVEQLGCQALRAIAENWLSKPLLDELPTLDDRDHLLELLSAELPFEVAVKAVPHQHYWQRAAHARWKFNDPSAHGDCWLQLYCERHLSEYLEGLDPAYFEAKSDECRALLELVREHVQALELRQLLPHRLKPRPIPPVGDDEDAQSSKDSPGASDAWLQNEMVSVIPLDLILDNLPHLRRIGINVGVVYSSDFVEWQDFQLSIEDALRISRGVKNLEHLSKFSLTRSYLDQPRAAAILQGLAVNSNVQEIDLSHCKLGDAGGLAIGGFLAERQPRLLRLVNCGIGSEGLAGIVFGILDDSDGPRAVGARGDNGIRHLDLRLNPLGDDGALHVAALLLRSTSLEHLNISGCSLGADGGMGIAEVLASGRVKFSKLELECSNNDFGTIVGEAFELVAKACTSVVGLDSRMCGFRKESEYSISESVNRNRARAREEKAPSRVSSYQTGGAAKRRQSLKAPPEFAIFQRPHEHPPSGPSSEKDVKEPLAVEGVEVGSESERFSEEDEPTA